jgi:hypothetical protein
MVFLIMGWVNTSTKLGQFRMHDIMWRYVKSTNHGQNLDYLQAVEKLYLGDPAKMKSLVEMEELHRKQIEESEQNADKVDLNNTGANANSPVAPNRRKNRKSQF